MNVEQELLRQGIAALEAGDKTRARKILLQAVKLNSKNDTAWYYLAKAQISPEKRRECLEQVLKINPDHLEAKRELDAMPSPTPHTTPPPQREDPFEAEFRILEGGKPKRAMPVTGEGGIRVPRGIPDAPERISMAYIRDYLQDMVRDGIAVFSNKPIADHDSTWWKIIFSVALVGFISGLAQVIAYIIGYFQFPSGFNLFYVLLFPFITLFTALVAVGAGVFVSHWYTTHYQGGRADLIDHAYPLVMVWTPASLLLAVVTIFEGLFSANALTLIQSILGGGSPQGAAGWLLTFVAAGVAIMSLLLMVRGLKRVYPPIPENALMPIAAMTLLIIALIF